MRTVRFTPEAERTLEQQIDYLISQGAIAPAQALKSRVEAFLIETQATYPRTGRWLPECRLWETWIPGTKLVAWYLFDDSELVVITFWHTSQSRPGV